MNGNVRGLAQLPIRLAVGGGLIYHGAPKLFSARGHENIVSMLKAMGVPQSDLAGWVVGGIEFFGGLALISGTRVRTVSSVVLGMVAFNLGAVFRRGGYPQPLPGGQPLPGVEDSCFYGGGALSLLLAGAGKASTDRWRAALQRSVPSRKPAGA
jgi:putative oxidoreductase